MTLKNCVIRLLQNGWIPDLVWEKERGNARLYPFCLFFLGLDPRIHVFLKMFIKKNGSPCRRRDLGSMYVYVLILFSRFPELQPHKGLFAPTFIAKIPNGQVCSVHGWIKKDNYIIQDFIPTCHPLGFNLQALEKQPFANLKKITGKVAVLTSKLDIYYSHWMYNILGRLALLESQGIEYDWLYVASDKPYMKESLALWGIDTKKLLDPLKDYVYIEADELIVPSQIGVRMPEPHQYLLNWVPLEIYGPKWGLDSSKIKMNNFF
jgi:hypothetical protein